ncbi:hypothetical protein M9458_031934, partial [Cirrhinus mrigala]
AAEPYEKRMRLTSCAEGLGRQLSLARCWKSPGLFFTVTLTKKSEKEAGPLPVPPANVQAAATPETKWKR